MNFSSIKNKILDVRVDNVDMNLTLKLCKKAIEKKELLHIVVLNVAKLIYARSKIDLFNIIEGADLVGADGIPIVWASRILGRKIPGRVNGTDLMHRLFYLSNKYRYSIYLFGAEQDVLERFKGIYEQKFPNIKIVGFQNGYFDRGNEYKLADQMRRSNADILFVAISSPYKEYFINKYKKFLGIPVIHGVGGSFDVVAGKIKRAPLWMQNYGLEWFFRLIQEPKRMWKRYLVTNFKFVILLFYYFLTQTSLKEYDD